LLEAEYVVVQVVVHLAVLTRIIVFVQMHDVHPLSRATFKVWNSILGFRVFQATTLRPTADFTRSFRWQ
jgi:hypothetical protein